MRSLSITLGVALCLAGCARLEVVDDGLGFAQRQQQLGQIEAWDARGRLAVADSERAYQARFSWQQRGEDLALVVRGLLGARSFRVDGNTRQLTVRSRGETETLTDPERQLSEMLGWWLPVTSAEHWLLGRADPGFDSQSSPGAYDTLDRLAQRDWEIAYGEYQLAEGRLFPREMTLRHAALELRLTILEWETSAGEQP